MGGERLEVIVEANQLKVAAEIITRVSGIAAHVDEGMRSVSSPVKNGTKSLMDALREFDEAKLHPLDIGLKRPSLDDVFLALTGHAAEETK